MRQIWLASVFAAAALAQPVSFQDLRNGLKDPTKWLMYSGDLSAQRYSPLTQITPANVNRMVSQWNFQTDQSPMMSSGRAGGLQSVPLAIDGVLYYAGTHNRVYAIDGRTGRQIWQYRRDLPSDVYSVTSRSLTRGVAVLGDRLFLGTLDAHILALDIKTGKVVWDTTIEDYKQYFSITSAPLVIEGNKIVVGIGGGDRGAHRFFLDAYDAQTGKRVWRFYTVPAPGEPGSETWLSPDGPRAGGATWTTGSYDPDLNLVYWGTGNPTGAGGANRPGDNLYTSSLVALDGSTGKLRWYYQTVPHDLHDYDATVIPVLADVKMGGQQRKVVLFAPKSGYLYVLDRASGKLLTANPMVESAKTWAKEIGPDGRPVLTKEDGTQCLADVHGGTNYWPPSYDPVQGLFFVTTHEMCEIFNTPQPGGVAGAPGSWTVGGAGYAALKAFDPTTGKQKWEYRYPPSDFGLTGVTPNRLAGIGLSGGVTTTASGLAFSGDNEGNFIAFDSRNGKPLWHYQTGSPVWGSAAMTYMLDGKQHVLISSGMTLLDFALLDAR